MNKSEHGRKKKGKKLNWEKKDTNNEMHLF